MNIINTVILMGFLLAACIIAWQMLKAIIVAIIEWFDDTPPGFT